MCEPKVQQFDTPLASLLRGHLAEQNVLRLDVAVNNALAVYIVKSVGDLRNEVARHAYRHELLALESVAKRSAIKKLHDHVGAHLWVFAKIDNRYDVGVGKRTRQTRFPKKLLSQSSIGTQVRMDLLERKDSPKVAVARGEDASHTALAYLLLNKISAADRIAFDVSVFDHGSIGFGRWNERRLHNLGSTRGVCLWYWRSDAGTAPRVADAD